jgi:hypothetical protein
MSGASGSPCSVEGRTTGARQIISHNLIADGVIIACGADRYELNTVIVDLLARARIRILAVSVQVGVLRKDQPAAVYPRQQTFQAGTTGLSRRARSIPKPAGLLPAFFCPLPAA